MRTKHKLTIHSTSKQTQEYDELVRKQRDEGAEKNFRKMRWDCRSCELSDNPIQRQNSQKPLSCFGVRNASDFVKYLLPQGKWTRCKECSHERKGQRGKDGGHLGKDGGHLGGNTNNLPEEGVKSKLLLKAKLEVDGQRHLASCNWKSR